MRRIFIRLMLLGVILFVACALLLGISGRREDVFPADVAVVPGNKVYPDGTPHPRLAARLDRALRLYHEGVVPILIVSGGVGQQGADEAEGMAAYLIRHNVPADAVVIDSAGVNTAATARFTAAWMARTGAEKVIAVSQYFHLPRTRLALEQAGLKHVGTACADYREWRDVYSVSREVAAYAVYYLRPWTGTLLGR